MLFYSLIQDHADKLMNMLSKFYIVSSFDVDFSKTKILIFGHNNRKLNQVVF